MKLWIFLCVAVMAAAGTVSAGIVVDVTFGDLAYDADGIQTDGQFIADYSGNGYHGFLGGGSGGLIVAGPTGDTALDSSTSNPYVFLRDARTYTNHGEPSIDDPITTQTPYFVFEAGNNYTIEAVLQWDPASPDSNHGIFGQTGTAELWLRENNGILQYIVDDGPTRIEASETIDISAIEADGQWHHLAFVIDRDASEIRLYVDYELIHTNANSNIAALEAIGDGTIDWRCGAYNTTSSNRFDGKQAHYRISDEALTPAEFISLSGVTAPVPADGQKGVLVDDDISWTAGIAPEGKTITAHYVYLGTDPTALALVDTTVSTTFDPGTLAKDSRYYWRVDEAVNGTAANDPNTIEGAMYSFETELSLPVIDTQPESTMAHPGEDAIFTIAATNPLEGELNYQWYFDPNLAVENDEVALGGQGYANTDTAELTVLAADENDEGAYYCVITNSNNTPVTSNTATFTLKELLGHWPFDSNLNDVVAGNNGSYNGTGNPTYPAGILGAAAIDFPVDTNAEEDYSIAIPVDPSITSFTISFWENAGATATQAWETIIGCGSTTGYEIMELNRYNATAWAVGLGGIYGYPIGGEVDRQQWVFDTITCDTQAGIWTWFVNGKAVATATGVNFAGFDGELFVGNVREGSQPFNGQIDDLKLFNFPMTPTEIAQAYYDVTGIPVCLEYSQMDFNQDCVVDVEDLAVILSQWLDCNLYPTCVDSVE
ncbi:MAG: immunoglobulin domain-containing protein [Phycisphaerae bacterium]|nr:immunoglobulin domain-containing protein [Phycisphaerae bacterium]